MAKSPAQLVAELDDIVREAWRHAGVVDGVAADPESLSIDILKLAALNVGVGNALAEAIHDHDQAELEYKYNLDKLKLEVMESPTESGKKVSATAAESVAKIELYALAEALIGLAHNVQVLKLKRADVDSVIDAARSRLSLIKQDIRNV